MSATQPPRLATWLGQRLVSSRRRDALVGDLLERYLEGESRAWYWRQVLLAIAASIIEDISAHKLLALRALLVGWTLYYLFAFPVIWAGRIAQVWVSEEVIRCEPGSFWCQFWRNQFSMELLIYVACAVSGWIVARWHRQQWLAMVSLYAASVLAFEYGMISWMLTRYPIPPTVQHGAPLVVPMLSVLARPLAVILGGFWSARPSPDAQHSVLEYPA